MSKNYALAFSKPDANPIAIGRAKNRGRVSEKDNVSCVQNIPK